MSLEINFLYGTAKAKNTNLIKLDVDIPQDTQVRLSVINSKGMSMKSEVKMAKCNTKACLGNFSNIIKNNSESFYKK